MNTPAQIPEKVYFRIGEVAELLGVEPHVVRFWQQQFPSIRPERSAAGRFLYSRNAVERLMRVRQLLYAEGYTIAGAKRALQTPPGSQHRRGAVATEPAVAAPPDAAPADALAGGAPATVQPAHGERRIAELEAANDRLERDRRALTARLEAAQATEAHARERLEGAGARQRAVLVECLAEADELLAAIDSALASR